LIKLTRGMGMHKRMCNGDGLRSREIKVFWGPGHSNSGGDGYRQL
jgi:hypothetical protein